MKANFCTHQFLLYIVLLVVFNSCKPVQNRNLDRANVEKDAIKQMNYAVTYLSVVPLRAKPEHRSEMVTQVLFGEYMKVLEEKEEWSFVQLEQDSYKGWLETSQMHAVTSNNYERFIANPKVKVLETNSSIIIDGKKIHLLKGTSLPFYSDGFFEFNNQKIQYAAETTAGKQNREKLIETAYSYLNTPYLWGGKTSFGIDCSGLTQMIYHLNGYSIQRDASLQAKQGELVAFLEQAEIGDLAFFDSEEGNITHVGIVLENSKIIHAAKGKVRIDSLDQEGIYNDELKKYTHHLRMVRSYL